jgi:predicted ATP-binding protein involved in virulence
MKRIKQISVKNLFGMFDHTIPLNLDERITIMHGPNGFGKTATLRLLDSLFSQDNSALKNIPFDEFYVYFEDNAYLQMRKITSNHVLPHSPSTTIRFSDGSQEEAENLFSDDAYNIFITENNIHFTYEIKPTIIDFTPNSEERDFMSSRAFFERSRNIALDKSSKWLKEMRHSVLIRFIETQRLLNPGKPGDNKSTIVLTVNTYSQELAEIINAKLAESTTLSQSLDRTFPARLVSPTVQQKTVVTDDLRKKLVELERKRLYLTTTGLLDQEGADSIQVQEQDQIDESTKVVLSVYAEDTEKKLGIFDELADKIDLLKRIINKRFLYKEMTISKEKGFVFTNSKGVVLSPNDLSSGEQHELILFYELLFKVAPGSLILIDEPEISLHVVWQEQFLEDVQAVTRLSDIDVLLATHSPDIIAGRRDLMVELKGPV